jgi:hypothetical protein
MSATEIVPWFQMGATIITGIGVMFSIFLGSKTLRNSARDRLEKIRPNLMFNVGGQQIDADLSLLTSFPGKDPEDPDLKNFKNSLPKDTRCYDSSEEFGQLFNYGAGAAYNVNIWFEADRIKTGDDVQRVTRTMQASPPYGKEWNSIPSTPSNLPSGEFGGFRILPACVYLMVPDPHEVSGTMFVECRDGDNRYHSWSQAVTFAFTRDAGNKATVIVSFQRR